MNRRKLRAVIDRSVSCLPPIRDPWSVDELCARLAEQRGRPVMLHAMRIPALPFGLWYDDGNSDHIIYRAGVTGYHRDHIVLHEIFHLLTSPLAGHVPSGDDRATDENSVRWLIERATRGHHADEEESAAEAFATRVLGMVARSRARQVSADEQRAATLFGIH